MKAARARRRKRREGRREKYTQRGRHGRRTCRPGRGRLLRRPIGSAEMDRGHQEEARRADSGGGGREAVRKLCVQRLEGALAVPAAGRGFGQWPGGTSAELSAQPRISRRFLARHLENGRHLQGGQQLLWARPIQGRPRAQGPAGQLPRAERRQSDGNYRRKNYSRRNHTGWARRLYLATGPPGIVRLT